MRLSEHFDSKEFECHCGCGEDFKVDPALIVLLEAIRSHFGCVITVNSGYRCEKHNNSKAVGSNSKSQHRTNPLTAADIVVGKNNPRRIADFVHGIMPYNGGIGRYETFTHVDVRKRKARWGK